MGDDDAAVIDDRRRHRFLLREGAEEAELVYRTEDGDRLVLVHTGVPDPLGGQGIGGRLVRAAVERAARTGETVAPWCPFARRWLREHPDVAATITIDWSEPPPEA